VRVAKIKREVKILSILKGGPNIVELKNVSKCNLPALGALIFGHINHVENIKTTMLSFSNYEVRFYMYQLAKALDYCHSKGIIHRDVKPQNLVIDRKGKRLQLIDFGLADFYKPTEIYNVRVASRHYKSPELLVNMQMYDYSVDLFAYGLTLFGCVARKIPFFRGADNVDQLYKIADVLGTVPLKKYLIKYGLKPKSEFTELLQKDTPRLELEDFHKRPNIWKHGGLYDLLENVLLYDHQQRLTAKECMEHQYFVDIHECEQNDERASIPDSKEDTGYDQDEFTS